MKQTPLSVMNRSALVLLSALTCLATDALWPVPMAWGRDEFLLQAGQWSPQPTLDPATPEGQLRVVRQALAQDQPDLALERINQWIKSHPNHDLLAQAYLLKGDCLVAEREYYKALYDYEHVIRHYPDAAEYETALEREFRIAKIFASGVKRRFLGMRILSAAGEAEEIFIRIQERIPGSELGQLASLALGDFYFDRTQMSSAAEAYELFLSNYPDSIHTERALLGLIRANLATFKGPRFDPTGLIEAAQRIKTFQQYHPAMAERIGSDALLVRIEESLALKFLYTAQWYEKRGDHREAIYTYQRVLSDHPRTVAATEALDRLRELAAPVTASAARAGAFGTAPNTQGHHGNPQR